MNKINTTNTNTNTFPAHSALNRGAAGKVIKQLPELRSNFPRVFVRYEDGEWKVSGTKDFKGVKQWIQAAELEAIAAVAAGSSLPSLEKEEAHCKNEDQKILLTGTLISNLKKDLVLPEGAKPVSFDNKKRVWVLRADTQDALNALCAAFDAFERKWYALLNPTVFRQVSVDEFSKKSRQITDAVKFSLKEIPLPLGSKRIWFDPSSFSWKFACQTEQDMDQLDVAFRAHVEKVIQDLSDPQPEKKTRPARRPQRVPDFVADFPSLTTNPSV